MLAKAVCFPKLFFTIFTIVPLKINLLSKGFLNYLIFTLIFILFPLHYYSLHIFFWAKFSFFSKMFFHNFDIFHDFLIYACISQPALNWITFNVFFNDVCWHFSKGSSFLCFKYFPQSWLLNYFLSSVQIRLLFICYNVIFFCSIM